MNKQQLAAIRERAGKATPGPWYAHNPDDAHCMNAYVVTTENGVPSDLYANHEDLDKVVAITLLQEPRLATLADHKWEENADFIAHARADVPALLSEIDRLRLALRQIADLADASEPLSVVACRWATEALDADAVSEGEREGAGGP